MLSYFSWNIFLSTAATLLAGYYIITLLLLYRKEITNYFKSKSSGSPEPQSFVSPVVRSQKSGSVMGGLNLRDALSNPRSSAIAAEDFIIAGEEQLAEIIEAPAPIRLKDDLIIGTLADLLEEIKTIAQSLSESEPDLTEAESLFRTLLLRYPNVSASLFRDAVTLFICKEVNEQASFDLSIAEAATWWIEQSVQKK